ncbi:TPA: ferric iron uptake transcriptional regulator [Neisseria gonorrhoeae]
MIVGKQAEIAYYSVYYFTGILNIMEKFSNIAQLKDSSLKVTGPRLKILDLFEKHAEEHLSAEDVYRILLEEGVEIGVATIYRVLTQFEQAGILQRHHFETGKAVYELDKGDHHDHIVCVKCGEVTEFHNPEIEALQDKIAEENGYRIVDHALYMYGVCSDCQAKGKR